jgi:hypothetical protein
MNTVNPATLLRSLLVYAFIVPIAILMGYLLANQMDYQSLGFMAVLGSLLVFPLLMKWHYPLLIFSWNLPATLFFLPGHPSLFTFMVVVSLGISVMERILDRNQSFVPAAAVRWPLIAFVVVILITAKLTGGFGFRSMGSDVYGGKKYFYLMIGILSFFAITARPIPKNKVNLYITLFFAGGFFNFIQDIYPFVPTPLQFIFLVFPPSDIVMSTTASGNAAVVLGQTRLVGISGAAGMVFTWMLARHGFKENFLTGKLWRPLVMAVMGTAIFLGGFRNNIIVVVIMLALLFYLEKMYRTGAMLAVLMAGVLGGALLIPLAPHLPYTFQRALAFLPLDIDPEARLDADASTQWRLDMWEALLPQIPKYLLLGKGYAFSQQTFNDYMGPTATFKTTINAAEDPLALSSDFHSGPLSVVLSFGIWGVLIWLWYWAAGFYVIWRNYHYGDPAFQHINLFLFASFLCMCFSFIFIYGGVVEDVGHFGGVIGLSLVINHGIRHPKSFSQPAPAKLPAPTGGRLGFPERPVYPALPG